MKMARVPHSGLRASQLLQRPPNHVRLTGEGKVRVSTPPHPDVLSGSMHDAHFQKTQLMAWILGKEP